ncbi:MAG: hypothetical protein ACKUBY_03300 [Candidatus Moraniibacteriota bacterium]|jgi:uncharacterized membrane protein YecN with MAPEG domain
MKKKQISNIIYVIGALLILELFFDFILGVQVFNIKLVDPAAHALNTILRGFIFYLVVPIIIVWRIAVNWKYIHPFLIWIQIGMGTTIGMGMAGIALVIGMYEGTPSKLRAIAIFSFFLVNAIFLLSNLLYRHVKKDYDNMPSFKELKDCQDAGKIEQYQVNN